MRAEGHAREGSPAPSATDPLATRRRAEIEATLAPIVRGASRVALVGFPTHGNVGDSAIWLGQTALLRRMGVRPAHACDSRTYDPARLRECAGDGVVLISGGGNLGDVWADPERLRERVLADVPRAHVVQLPQTIRFETPEGAERARRAFRSHPRVTILVRDRQSLERARDDLGMPAMLCPDAAFGLGPLALPRGAGTGVLALLRRDRESALAEAPPPGVRVADWPREPRTLARRAQRLLARSLRRWPGGSWWRRAALERTYEPVARSRLEAGLALLASARAVVTDRLHGHLLCVLTGMPHVVLGDRHGKVRGVREAWTLDAPHARDARTLGEALALAGEMAG